MGTQPEGPALERPHDTTVDEPKRRRRGPSIAHDHTVTPAIGITAAPTLIAAPKPKELESGVMVGEYRIEHLLGEGGMGRVYAAVHPVIGKRAAVKVLHPRMSSNQEVVERFIQEARAVNEIGHPNIVDIFAFGQLPEDGTPYFVMEWLKGESLQQRMYRQPLTREEVCRYVQDISHALEAAHEQEIVHRDLKPENVFLHQVKGDRLQIKLLDFGIAKLANTEDNRIERTRTGAMMGTPKYIAPEQARGYTVDHRADIYSLGVMLFELIAGRLPFEADNAMDLVAMHLQDTPPLLSMVVPGVPRILDEVVYTMLAKEVDQRPSLAHLRQVLEAVHAMPPGDAASTVPDLMVPGTSSPSITPRSRRRFVIAGIAAIGVFAGSLLLVRSIRSDEEAPPVAIKTETPIAVTAPDPKPEPKPPIVVTKGTLHAKLKKGTTNATLVINDRDQPGNGPWNVSLEPGEYTVTLKSRTKTRAEPLVEQIKIESDKASEVEVGFAPIVLVAPTKPIIVKPRTKPTGPTGSSADDFIAPKKQP